MKFCHKCGEMLDDNAIVCPRCGASQGASSNAEYSSQYEKSNLNNGPSQMAYQPQEITDEKFLALLKLSRMKQLLNLSSLLLVYLALMLLLFPLFAFTGNRVGVPTLTFSSYPHGFNIIEFFKYNDNSFKYKEMSWGLGPDPLLTIPSMMLGIGVLFPATIGLVGCLVAIPANKQRVYQSYMTNNVNFIKNLKSVVPFIMIFFGIPFPLVGLIILKVGMNNMVYSQSEIYAYGEVALNSSTFTAALVLAIIIPILLVTGLVLITQLVIKKKVEEIVGK